MLRRPAQISWMIAKAPRMQSANCLRLRHWPSPPQAPTLNGGNASCTQRYDAGTKWAAGAGGQTPCRAPRTMTLAHASPGVTPPA